MRGFEFRLCLSVCLSLALSVGVLSLLVSSAWFWSESTSPLPPSRNCLLYRFSLLIGSNWFLFFFWFWISRKITFNYFYFLTNFIDISLSADLFSILKKVSAPITSGECSRGRLLQSLFCMYDELERDLFRSYKNHLTVCGQMTDV